MSMQMRRPESTAERRPTKLTLSDIGQWVDNDEGLYNWWRSSRQPKRKFITENRDELERCIRSVLDRKPTR